jgi:hypothetical protein
MTVFELLEGVDGETLRRELILINVVNLNFTLFRWDVCHDEILLDCSGKY